jgi:hypothetical protein
MAIDSELPLIIKPAAQSLFFEPPLQGMEVAVVVPFTLFRRLGYLQPIQLPLRHDSPYLKGKDNHAVIIAPAALAAAQALKSDPLDLAGQGLGREAPSCGV